MPLSSAINAGALNQLHIKVISINNGAVRLPEFQLGKQCLRLKTLFTLSQIPPNLSKFLQISPNEQGQYQIDHLI